MIMNLFIKVFYLFRSLGLFGAGLSMVIENVGVPLPTEIGYLIGRDAISTGKASFLLVIVVLTLGHLVGSLISYSIGRWGDRAIVAKLKDNHGVRDAHDKLKVWFNKYGNLAVFLARFVGYVRPWSSYVAGFAGVPLLPFVAWTTLGSLLFNIIAVYLSGILLLIWRRYTELHLIIISISFLLFFGLIIFGLVSRFMKKKIK